MVFRNSHENEWVTWKTSYWRKRTSKKQSPISGRRSFGATLILAQWHSRVKYMLCTSYRDFGVNKGKKSYRDLSRSRDPTQRHLKSWRSRSRLRARENGQHFFARTGCVLSPRFTAWWVIELLPGDCETQRHWRPSRLRSSVGVGLPKPIRSYFSIALIARTASRQVR